MFILLCAEAEEKYLQQVAAASGLVDDIRWHMSVFFVM